MSLTAPSQYKGKPIFKNLTIATACSFEGQWTDANITRWVTQRSGSYSLELDGNVTHLIIPQGPTRNQKDNPRIKQALKRGAKACHVVTLDWLEDSMLKNKKLPEKPYLLTTLLKNEGAREREAAKKTRATELEDRFVNTNYYHLYHDSNDYFRYEIVITRDQPPYGAEGQRYVLYLFESNAKPHLYWFAAKHYRKKGDSQPSYYRPSDSPRVFWAEYSKFKEFYKKKTGGQWDERLMGKKVVGGDGSEFRYIQPALGKPVGWVPVGCERSSTPLVEEKVPVASEAELMKTAEDMAAETARYEQYARLVQDATAIEEQRMRQAQQKLSSYEHRSSVAPLEVQPRFINDDAIQSFAPAQAACTAPATPSEGTLQTALEAQPTKDKDVDMCHGTGLEQAAPLARETGFVSGHDPIPSNNIPAPGDLHSTSIEIIQQQSHDFSVPGQGSYHDATCATANQTRAMSELHAGRTNLSPNAALESATVKAEVRADHQNRLGLLDGKSSAGNTLPRQKNDAKDIDGEEDKENTGAHQDVIMIDD